MRAPFGLLVVLVAAAALAGCTVPAPPGDAPLRYRDQVFTAVDVTRDLPYGTASELTLDLYRPAGDAATGRPAIVFVHGGGFSAGDKSAGAGFANAFARRGFVVVSINYRLLAPPGCGGQPDPSPDCQTAAIEAQHDAQAAVRWLRLRASDLGVDPDRIAMAGSSAGAITSLLVAWHAEDPGSSGNPGPSSAVQAAVSISGGAPTNELITPGDAPAIFFHGTADLVVPYRWAVSNAAAMYRLGLPVVLEPFEGAGHGLVGAGYGDVIYEQSAAFLYYMLDLAHAGGQTAGAARAIAPYEDELRALRP